jgi:hypothetical protein
MDTSDRQPSGDDPADPEGAGGGGACGEEDRVFRTNLEAFGSRAAQLCLLFRRRRISADSCFMGLTQLWIQLVRSHRRLGEDEEEDRGEGRETGRGKDTLWSAGGDG